MNPLQRLNAKQLAHAKAVQARKRAFERKVAAVLVSLLLLILCAMQYQTKPVGAIVAVDAEDIEPASLLAYAPQDEVSHRQRRPVNRLFPHTKIVVTPKVLVNGKSWPQMNGDERYEYAGEYTKVHCRPLYDDPPWYPKFVVVPFLVAHNDENWLKAKIRAECIKYATSHQGR